MKYRVLLGVEPEPGNREGWARTLNQTQHLNIEISCRLQLVGDDGEVVHAQDHRNALNRLLVIFRRIVIYCSYSCL
ncbi:hypothetical protein D3C85_1684690 [compost metagenome]